jgi:hypothetical protein
MRFAWLSLRKFKRGMKSSWQFPERIVVSQTLELVSRQPVVVGEDYKTFLDTCLIRYKIENRDDQPHNIGMRFLLDTRRFLLDTLIPDKDEPYFALPGQIGLLNSPQEYEGDRVPDFVQVLGKANLRDPGAVARIVFRLGKMMEAPGKVAITRRPKLGDFKSTDPGKYEIPTKDSEGTSLIGFQNDSAVVLYWKETILEKRAVRELGFSYGVSSLSSPPK